jgi:GxxExxY protein
MSHRRGTESTEVTEGACNGLTHAVIGAAIEVHRQLGPGLLETVYESALCRELFLRGIKVGRQVPLQIKYKGADVGSGLRLDLVVADRLIVEVKSLDHLAPIHRSQVLTYLKLTGLRLGLLINFNVTTLRCDASSTRDESSAASAPLR